VKERFPAGQSMKKKLRTQKLLERLAHHPLQKKEKDELIRDSLKRLPEFKKAQKILFYMPVHGEVDLSPIQRLYRKVKKFILPRVKDETTLHLYYIDCLEDVEKGSFKILEPKLHLKKAAPAQIDLVLVPGVVFSKDGHRIGYGKGFYDRLLKQVKCPKIGIAYDFQIVENIPAETHDTPMDMIITDKRSMRMTNAE
jgi:5-formyltetrahydrofolate cyclo-ligase